jgi:hypothetical protein
MTTEVLAQLVNDQLGRVRAAWPGGAWEWDGRFGCALSTVGKAQEARAREALATALPAVWTVATLAEAPAPIQELCAHVGGLRGDQLVLTGDLGDGALAYCLWWPWGSGANFSARLGAIGAGRQDLATLVRSALGMK